MQYQALEEAMVVQANKHLTHVNGLHLVSVETQIERDVVAIEYRGVDNGINYPGEMRLTVDEFVAK